MTPNKDLEHFQLVVRRRLIYFRMKLEEIVNEVAAKTGSDFFFDKGENASQGAEIAIDIYGANTVTANYVQFWFRRFRSGIFDVKDVPRIGRSIVKYVDKIKEII
ncbi:histone-lysine N-methyltransferase SETMAR [Trichonephila clavipes]|nr:histone-lysine N-methyltransferase SETMAR [Trichonephila clavipes]